jgi:hypothetical protein
VIAPAVAIAQDPAPVAMTAETQGEALRVSLESTAAASAGPCVDPRELLLSFDGPVRLDLPPSLLDSTVAWLAGVQTGYDTVLLRAARDVRFEVSRRGEVLDVLVVPEDPTEEAVDAQGRRRLDLLRAQWLAEAGREGEAFEALSAVVAKTPGDAQALTALGLSERRIGWRRRATATLQRAFAADGANPDLRELLASMQAEREPLARADFEQKTVAGEYRTRSQRSEGARAINDALQIGGRLEFLHVDAKRVRHPDGAIAPLRRTLGRGEAWLRLDTLGGTSWSGSLFASPAGPGASVEYARPQPSGQWRVQAEVQRPFWEYTEAFAGDGTRDRAAVGRRQRLWRHVEGWVTVAANRYALDDGATTKTTGISGGVIAVVREAQPFVAASYGLDKETRRSGTTRTDAAGVPFDPVPIVSREIHVPGVQVRQELGRSLSIDAYSGYAIDRLGGRGAVAEVHARFARGRTSAEVWVDRRLQTLATTTTVTRVGAGVAIRF